MLTLKNTLDFLRFKPVFHEHIDFEKHERYLRYKIYILKKQLSKVCEDQVKFLVQENEYLMEALRENDLFSEELSLEELIKNEVDQFKKAYGDGLKHNFHEKIILANEAFQKKLNEFYKNIIDINVLLVIYLCGRKLDKDEEAKLGVQYSGDPARFKREDKLAVIKTVMEKYENEVIALQAIIDQYVLEQPSSSVYYHSIELLKNQIKKAKETLESAIKNYKRLIRQEKLGDKIKESDFIAVGKSVEKQFKQGRAEINDPEAWSRAQKNNIEAMVTFETNNYQQFLNEKKDDLAAVLEKNDQIIFDQYMTNYRREFFQKRKLNLTKTFDDYITKISNVVADVYHGRIMLKIHKRLAEIAETTNGKLTAPKETKEKPLVYHLRNDEKIQEMLHDEMNQSDPRIVIIRLLLDEEAVDEEILLTYLNEHSVKSTLSSAGYKRQQSWFFARSTSVPVPKSGESVSTSGYSITYHAPALEDGKGHPLSAAKRERLLEEQTEQFFELALGWRGYLTFDSFGQCVKMAEEFVGQLRRFDHMYSSNKPIVFPTMYFEDTSAYRNKRWSLCVIYAVLVANGVSCAGFTPSGLQELQWYSEACEKISYNYEHNVTKYEVNGLTISQ